MSRAKVRNARIVLVTCPSLALARKIARAVVEKRLAACVNVVRSPVESFYTWKGRLESAREHLLLIKTAAESLSGLEREVKRLHTYAVPELDRKSTRLNSSHVAISYAVFCLKKKTATQRHLLPANRRNDD